MNSRISADETLKRRQDRKELIDSLEDFAALPTGTIAPARYRSEIALGEEIVCLKAHEDWVSAVGIAGEAVFSCSDSGAIHVSEEEHKQVKARCVGHEKRITAIQARSDPALAYNEILTCSWDMTARKWRIPKDLKTQIAGQDEILGTEMMRWMHHTAVQDLDTQGGHLFTACADGRARRWPLLAVGRHEAGEELQEYGARGVPCTCVRVWVGSSTSTKLLVSHEDGHIAMYDIETAELVQIFETESTLCMAVQVSTFISGGADHIIRMWDLVAGEQVGFLEGHYGPVTCLLFGPETIWSGSTDRTIREWQVASGEEIVRYRGHSDHILCIARQGASLCSGSADCSSRIWHVSNLLVPHVPYYRLDTLDGKSHWPEDASNLAGHELYCYKPDFK